MIRFNFLSPGRTKGPVSVDDASRRFLAGLTETDLQGILVENVVEIHRREQEETIEAQDAEQTLSTVAPELESDAYPSADTQDKTLPVDSPVESPAEPEGALPDVERDAEQPMVPVFVRSDTEPEDENSEAKVKAEERRVHRPATSSSRIPLAFRVLASGLAVLALLYVAAVGPLYYLRLMAEQKVSELSSQAMELQTTADQAMTIEQQATQQEIRIEDLRSLLQGDRAWSNALTELALLTPPSVHLTELRYDAAMGQGLEITGYSAHWLGLARFLNGLRESSWFNAADTQSLFYDPQTGFIQFKIETILNARVASPEPAGGGS